MRVMVVYLDEVSAQDVFHESGLREWVFAGWNVVRPHRDWGAARYTGPYETREAAERAMSVILPGIDQAASQGEAGCVLGGNVHKQGG